MIDDLKPSSTNRGPLTPGRAFTLAELVVFRVRDARGRTDEERALLTRAAALIGEVAAAWR